MRQRWRNPLTLRATLALMGGIAGVYAAAVGTYVVLALAPAAQQLRSRAEGLKAEYAVLGARAADLRDALDSLRRLARAGAGSAADRQKASAVRAALQIVTGRFEGVRASLSLTGIPPAMRVSLADAANAESHLAGVLLETLDYLDLGDVAAARSRLARADALREDLGVHLDEAQDLGLADVVESERILEARARQIVRAIGLWVLLGAILLVLALLLLRRRLYLPLRTLDRGLAGVAGGDLKLSLPVLREDEMGRLTAHFNQMTAVLRDRAEEERRRATSLVDTQAATYRISEAALTAPTLQDLYAAIHRIVGELMPAHNFYIALQHPSAGTITFPYFVDEFDPTPAPKQPGKGLTEYVLRTGKALLATPDVARELERRGEIELIGAPSIDWLGVPLRTGGKTIGILVVQTYTEGVRYGEEDREVLQFVSTQVAMAIERKRSQEAVRRSEEQYRALVDGVKDVIFALSPDAAVMALNPAFEQVTGYRRDEWIGKPFTGLLHPDDVPTARELIGMVLRGQSRGEVRLRVRTKSAEYRVGEFRADVQRRDGEAVGIYGIVRDITDRVRLEEQLRQAQKMEAVGRLAGGVAHDFNNILTAISSYGELLLADLARADPRRADVEEIRKATERAAGLTRQLLAFSRQQVLQPRMVDLNGVITGAEKLLRRLIGEDIALVTRLDPALAPVRADAGQLEQVIMNLAVNARDAMQKGGTLTLETGNLEIAASEQTAEQSIVAPGSYVLLRVSDTGSGMDAKTKRHIFEPFFTTRERGKGTGLGLATVYGIVKQSGGFIWVDSEPGHGTAFRIYFPAASEAVASAAAPAAAAVQRGAGTETILVVEDEDAVRAVARESLRRRGYTVLEAADAPAALQVSTEFHGKIELLLTDVVMPGLSGRALADRFATLRPDTRVLYMSGYTDDAIVQHGVLEPGLNYLQKPFTPDVLTQKVREVLDGPAH